MFAPLTRQGAIRVLKAVPRLSAAQRRAGTRVVLSGRRRKDSALSEPSLLRLPPRPPALLL